MLLHKVVLSPGSALSAVMPGRVVLSASDCQCLAAMAWLQGYGFVEYELPSQAAVARKEMESRQRQVGAQYTSHSFSQCISGCPIAPCLVHRGCIP